MSHRHDPSASSQNSGNSLGSRPCVRQSERFKSYESGNSMKALISGGADEPAAPRAGRRRAAPPPQYQQPQHHAPPPAEYGNAYADRRMSPQYGRRAAAAPQPQQPSIAELERELAELRSRASQMDSAAAHAHAAPRAVSFSSDVPGDAQRPRRLRDAMGGAGAGGYDPYGEPLATAPPQHAGSRSQSAMSYADVPGLENLNFENANPNVGAAAYRQAPPAVRQYQQHASPQVKAGSGYGGGPRANTSGGSGDQARQSIYGGGHSSAFSHAPPSREAEQKMRNASGGHGHSAKNAIYGGAPVDTGPLPAERQPGAADRASGGHGRSAKSAIYGGYVPSLQDEAPRRRGNGARAPRAGSYGFGAADAVTTSGISAGGHNAARSFATNNTGEGMPNWWG